MTAAVAFSPIGEKSRRVQVIEAAAKLEFDEVLTYEHLQDLLSADRPTVQAAVHAAIPGLQTGHKKTLEAVRNVGYRVVRPNEHLRIATKHQKKGRRSTRRGKLAVVNTDYSELTEEERAKADTARQIFDAMEAFERRADLRYASKEKVDQFIAGQSQTNLRTVEEVDGVKERLARLEQLVTARRG